MTKSRKPPSDYVVGYGKPPEASRFKPGQSGNPKGRPKKDLDIKALLQAMTQQKLTIPLDGRRVRMPSLEVMLKNNYTKALKGDPRTFDRFLKLLHQYGIAVPKEEGEAAPVDENDEAIIEAFLRKRQSADDDA